ncbi:hypothetical protein NQ317_000601 [Molorchus minor]|uniref:Tf2-1-like SH3-like domain-containing protein n=1 Tax=Molorchus minor TaxID=1323400 RepID=A0ABQ9JAD8_9CUCU|nr:hypothetical protein NQ317_000601 [Molorchus minor]
MAVLDFILSHADGDERPYLSVSILGTSMSGLLDSGASNTIIGGPGWEVISKLNLPLNKSDKVRCRVANGEVCVGSSINEERANGFARVYSDVKKRLQHAYENSKSHYNLRRRDEQFLPNDHVWRKNYVQSDASKYFAAKLAPRFVGPYRVAKRLSPWTYELVDNENKFGGVWHAKDLKAHPPDNSDN